jgi:hypothetical protein
MNLTKYILLSILLVSFACQKEEINFLPPTENPAFIDTAKVWTTYIIPAGQNFSLNNNLVALDTSFLDFGLTFDSSAIYQSVLPSNQADWNKVTGFSDCGQFHQTNSLRLGWRWTPPIGIELAAYYYTNSQRGFQTIDTVQVGDTIDVSLQKMQAEYLVQINARQITVPRGCNATSAGNYKLYPYFGGVEVAPDTVRVHIKWKNP